MTTIKEWSEILAFSKDPVVNQPPNLRELKDCLLDMKYSVRKAPPLQPTIIYANKEIIEDLKKWEKEKEMSRKPEYELGDRVSFEGHFWYVAGIRLHTGYATACWEYALSSHFFGNSPGKGWEYTKNHPQIYEGKWLRHEQLGTVEELVILKQKDLEKERQKLEKELELVKEKLRNTGE